MKNYRLFRIFDDARLKRNSLVYYGKMIGVEAAKISIKNLINFIREIGEIVGKS